MQNYSVMEIFGLNQDTYPHYLASFTITPQGKLKKFETTRYINSALKFCAKSEYEEAYELIKEIKLLAPNLECGLRKESFLIVSNGDEL